jgi:predicted transcriptional regulator
MERYRKQYEIVLDILDTLNKNPENKQALIEKFEKMQEYGNPPHGIEHGFGIK